MGQVFYTFLITTETPEEGVEYFVIKHDEKLNLRVFPIAEEDIYNWVDNPRYKDILTDNSYCMFRDCLPKNFNDISGFSYIRHKIISMEVIKVSRDRFDWISSTGKSISHCIADSYEYEENNNV